MSSIAKGTVGSPELAPVRRSIAWWRRRSVVQNTGRTAAIVVILLGAIIVIFPIVWMLSTSLKTIEETQAIPIKWIPSSLQWTNFPTGLTVLPFATFFRNTAIITFTSLVGTVLSAALVGYGFARLRAPGRELLFLLVLATLILPSQVTVIPKFILFSKLGWVNTFAPLVVPTYFGAAFNIFLLRQFFRTIPRDMDEAAIIDGAGYLKIWWQVILPMSLPALGIIAIFHFIFEWNDFFDPLIYLSNNDLWTVALGLNGFTAAYGATPYNLLMAASLVAVLPCIILFFLAQRYFVQGIVVSGVKG